MRRHPTLRRVVSLAVIWSLVALMGITTATPALAHCGTQSGNWYVYGGNPDNTVRGARTFIDWVDRPQTCGARVFHFVSVGGTNVRWVQVGWMYEAGDPRTYGYCERARPASSGGGTEWERTKYAVAETRQSYAFVRPHGGNAWDCRIDGTTLESVASSWVGFTNATWVPVAAETHRAHAQVGRINPGEADLSETAKVLSTDQGDPNWSQMNLYDPEDGNGPCCSNSFPDTWNYGIPNSDGFWVSTDGDHG